MMIKSVPFSKVENRLDAAFYRDDFEAIRTALTSAPDQVERLGDLAAEIRKGIFDIKAHQYVDSGVPFIRISQIRDFSIDDSDIVYITEEENTRNHRTCLSPGDLVIAKSGATMGKAGYIPSNFSRANISQDIIGVKGDFKYSRYLIVFLSTIFGQMQMQRAGSQQAQQHLNLERARDLRVFLPSDNFMCQIDDLVQSARQKQLQADTLLQEAETRLSNLLNTEQLRADLKTIYRTPFSSISDQIRLDAEYYNPKYVDIYELLEGCPYEAYRLSDIEDQFKLSNDKLKPSNHPQRLFKYITISSVDEHTGQIREHEEVLGHDAPSRARMKIKAGDVLVPYLSGSSRAVAVVREKYDGEVATTGYYILRPRDAVPEFLFMLMRSPVIQYQIERKTSGAVMTSINKTDFKRIIVPVIPKSIQEEIGGLARKSLKLRQESQSELASSKDQVTSHIKNELELNL